MAETVTPNDPSGGLPGEGVTPPAPSGGPGEAPADVSALENRIAQLEAQGRGLQGALDKAVAKLEALGVKPDAAPPAPSAPAQGLTLEQMRAELRRTREIDAAVGALKEQFPNASRTLADPDAFESIEALKFAAENEQKAFEAQVSPAVEAAVTEALKPYVEKFGPLQTAPAGAVPGAGDGLPTLVEITAMSLDELDALEKQHPGLHQRLLAESLT